MKWKDAICTLNLMRGPAPRVNHVSERLSKAVACVEYFEQQRAREQDPDIGKVIEDRIVWRELLDLELQQVDEQIERICRNADKAL